MRSCEDYEELISARLDDALTDEERAALDAHLAGCPRCRRTADELAQVDAALRSLAGAAAVEPVARVLEQIEPSERVVPLRRPRRALWGVACAAVLAVVLVAGSGPSLFPVEDGGAACDTSILAAEARTVEDGASDPVGSDEALEPDEGTAGTGDGPASGTEKERGQLCLTDQRPVAHGADGSGVPESGDAVEPPGDDTIVSTTGGTEPSTGMSGSCGGGASPDVKSQTVPEEPSGEDGQSTAPLSEEGAAAALRTWLGAADAPLTALGPADDGGAWRFASDGRTFAVDAADGTVTEEDATP